MVQIFLILVSALVLCTPNLARCSGGGGPDSPIPFIGPGYYYCDANGVCHFGTVDATTLSGHAADYFQPADADLTALAGIAGQRGDVIYYGASGWTRLGKGNANDILSQGANDPAWTSAPILATEVFTPLDNGDSGASKTIDWTTARCQLLTLTGSPGCTLTFTLPAGSKSGFLTLLLIQGSGGLKTVIWPATIRWPGGVAPTLTTSEGAHDIISCFYSGTITYCSYGANDFKVVP
jgi:hypothetical protein